MRISLRNNKAFTLIELLVVVAIISLLASVILASLSSARAKAKDAAIRAEMNQFRNLLEQEYNDNGSYLNLNTGYNFAPNNACGDEGMFYGDYSVQAIAICNAILSSNSDLNNNVCGPNLCRFYAGNVTGTNPNYFSIMAWLPGKQTFLCIGSSGRTSDIEIGASWDSPGCWGNP